MNKAILIIDMPSCCSECNFLNDNYDYPECIITGETRGYTFRTRERRMDKCPLKQLPEKLEGNDSIIGNKKIENNNHCFDCKYCEGWECTHPYAKDCMNSSLWTPRWHK